jgi:hypothetical protein
MRFQPDYDKVIANMRQVNFDLKLRIHLLEDRLIPGLRTTVLDDARHRIVELSGENSRLRNEVADLRTQLEKGQTERVKAGTEVSCTVWGRWKVKIRVFALEHSYTKICR